jgi:outer membrane protein OmpA-like peptidoglycan-associated protein
MTTKTVRPRSRIEECHRQNSPVLRCFNLSLVASGLSLAVLCAQAAVAQTNIPKIAAATCAVMSGERKADGQTLQYLLLLDQDLGDANPVALALYQEVIKQCPKAYLNYQQRKKAGNPFPPGSLVKPGSTQLTNSGSSSSNPSTSSQTSSRGQPFDPQKPAALGSGVNKGNVDNVTGAHYYYFWAGPGHIDMKMAFKEMGVLGNPFQQALTFDFYGEDGKLISHNAVVSKANLARVTNSGDLGSRHKIVLAVVPQKAIVKLGGYYEIEVTGAATFDGSASASTGVTPQNTALIQNSGIQLSNSGTELYKPGASLSTPGGSLYKPGQALTVSETSKEIRLALSADVLFDFDKAIIRPDGAAALQQVVAVIRDKNHGVVRIEGHTDSKGNAAYNMRLSQQRAVAVETWLVQNGGFTVSSFSTQGFGATRPIAENTKPDGTDDSAGRQRNRRVELILAK